MTSSSWKDGGVDEVPQIARFYGLSYFGVWIQRESLDLLEVGLTSHCAGNRNIQFEVSRAGLLANVG